MVDKASGSTVAPAPPFPPEGAEVAALECTPEAKVVGLVPPDLPPPAVGDMYRSCRRAEAAEVAAELEDMSQPLFAAYTPIASEFENESQFLMSSVITIVIFGMGSFLKVISHRGLAVQLKVISHRGWASKFLSPPVGQPTPDPLAAQPQGVPLS